MLVLMTTLFLGYVGLRTLTIESYLPFMFYIKQLDTLRAKEKAKKARNWEGMKIDYKF